MICYRIRRFGPRASRLFFVALAAWIFLLFTTGTVEAARLKDIQNHWASSAVENLLRRNVVVGYPDGTFKPDRLLSRAEFARMAVRAFDLPEAVEETCPDTVGHWAAKDIAALLATGAMEPSADGRFRPERPVSRREVVVALARLLGFGQKEQLFGEGWPVSYPDVPSSDPDFRLIELARRLGYLPPSYAPSFQPGASVTRAEAAWMCERVLRIKSLQGTLIGIEPELGLMTVEEDGKTELTSLRLDPDVLVLRNNAAVDPAKLLPGDRVMAFIGTDGLTKAVKASGKANADDLAARLQALTKGLLRPETVRAILTGDWEAARADLELILFERLVEMGLSPGEAQSLLARDWVTLDLLSREELVLALSSRIGISTELAEAILARDLARVKELLQTELVALAVGRLLVPSS
ncbi:MAG: S-layer homology domain-containing protein [Firmicutes bacterium]|nr:S-layer homology domain-containing protein [Bacillota bacterium]